MPKQKTKPRQLDDAGLPPEAVRLCLERMLRSAAFKATPQRRKLLEYVVEQTMAGRDDRLKAFELAVVVLGRNEQFDPQTDPIVRIEMGRLRRELEHYYEDAGHDDPIRIDIPKGNYIPAFVLRDPAPAASASAPRGAATWARWHVPVALVALCLLVLAGMAWWWASWRDRDQPQAAGPAVLVLPFEALTGGEGGRLLASGLSGGLVTDLMRFDGLQVFAGSGASQGGPELPSAALGAPAYVLSGSVQRESRRALVTARLTERATGHVLWGQTYERPLTTEEIYDVQADLTAAIVGRLAQVYGVVSEAATKEMRQARPATLFAYDCVQQAFAYRRTATMDTYPAVRNCLEEAVRRDPGYASAWAMLGFAHLDAVRFGLVPPAAKASEMEAALKAAQRAVELAPTGVPGLQSLGAVTFALGDFDEAERLQRLAIELNPQNPESLAQLGWRLTKRGRWQEGTDLLQQAIDRSVVIPNWYHTGLAIGLYLGGEVDRARDAAEAGKGFCCGLGQATLAITEAASGHTVPARLALDEAMRQSPILARDPGAFWLTFQVAPSVVDTLNTGLARAGLQKPTAAAAAASQS